MPTDHIVALLIAERDKLDRAIEALRETKTPTIPAIEGPAAESNTPEKKVNAASRRKMAIAQTKRWAAINAAKAAAAPAAVAPKVAPAKEPGTPKKKAAPARNAAYRKMMSLKMKAAWEKRKKAIGRGRPTAREL
jgi:hypothetical protein